MYSILLEFICDVYVQILSPSNDKSWQLLGEWNIMDMNAKNVESN